MGSERGPNPDVYELNPWDDEPDDMFDPAEDCMLRHDGQCGAAGSEFCDFECPYRDSELFAGSAAWIAAHKAKDAP